MSFIPMISYQKPRTSISPLPNDTVAQNRRRISLIPWAYAISFRYERVREGQLFSISGRYLYHTLLHRLFVPSTENLRKIQSSVGRKLRSTSTNVSLRNTFFSRAESCSRFHTQFKIFRKIISHNSEWDCDGVRVLGVKGTIPLDSTAPRMDSCEGNLPSSISFPVRHGWSKDKTEPRKHQASSVL